MRGRDRRFNQCGIHGERSRIDIHQHRLSACVENRRNAGDEREWDGDYFIARTDTRRE